jgi:hypothetical protein
VRTNKLFKNFLTAAFVSWSCSILLGFFFAVCTSGRLSIQTLRLPGVFQITFLTSTFVAALITPLVMWSFRNYTKGFIFYGGALFLILLIFIAIMTPNTGAVAFYGSVVAGVVGLVIIGFIPR